MHSRAYLLLKRDLENLHRFPIEGVSGGPCSELNIMQWQATLQGPSNTPWEGGIFHLRLKFSADFNCSPPAIQFMTIPFHPNIDPVDGIPNCHILQTGWNEHISIPILLIALQALLSSPELDDKYIVNGSAHEMLQRTPHAYHQMTRDCVTASLRVNAGLAAYDDEEEEERRVNVSTSTPPDTSLPAPLQLPTIQSSHSVSYDDYISLWRDIATSIPPTIQQNTAVGQAATGSKRVKSGISNFQKKLHQHHVMQYGQGGSDVKRLTTSQCRQQRIEQLKLAYTKQEGDDDNIEIDHLLEWTKSLDNRENNDL